MRTMIPVLCTLLLATVVAACAAEMPMVPSGFSIERIAVVPQARELTAVSNGDVIVGTEGKDVYVIPHAQASAPEKPVIFVTMSDEPAAGVAVNSDTLFVGTQFGVYRIPYRAGQTHAQTTPQKIVSVRTSGVSRDHVTTSVAVFDDTLWASVGSSCNACSPDLDATRASIQRINLAHGSMQPQAIHVRNAIALTVNPATHTLWAGVAGVDDLAVGHPYEIFDAVTLHKTPQDGATNGVVNYGWPSCYENHKVHPKWPADCSHAAVQRVALPAYATPIGAVFYPLSPHGHYAFPAKYRGGAFVTLHGSWHGPAQGLTGFVAPRVAFIPMHDDTPTTSIQWSDPNAQWSDFVTGYQTGGSVIRSGRPTGITVSPDGSLFVADDQTGAIYRIRPKR